jgi:suppressor for copper-sensitivity B
MRLLAAAIMILTSLLSSYAHAEDPIKITLLNGGYSGNTGTVLMGLDVEMPDGWHTYWKTAGEGGFPPEIDTAGSENLGSFDLKWPAPERIETVTIPGEPAVQTNGYMKRAVLPILVKPADPTKNVGVTIALRLYACKDYCAAFERKFTAVIPPKSASTSDQRQIAEWLRKVPRSSKDILSIGAPQALGDGRLLVTAASIIPMANPWLHIANADNMPYTIEADTTDPLLTRFMIAPKDGSFSASRRLEFVATANGNATTATYDRPVADTPLSWEIIITAFIGGLILNVMPCVFPVLSLKLMALTSGNARTARMGFAASSLGIVSSFLLLGAVLAGMKAAGAEIGWGIQFQNPVFLTAMTAIVLAFALGTAGLFEIALPQTLATKATRFTNGHGFGASLGQGFVATLLATPCSAPFVGTAVGFALAGGTVSILAVFGAMGVGMALPYFLISVTPGLSRVLPKPGVWMQRVRLVLSLALFATGGWLATTLSSEMGTFILVVSSTVLLAVAAMWLARRKPKRSAFVLLAALAFATPATIDMIPVNVDEGVRWQTFRPDDIQDLVAKGQTVLVSVTADWCITCKVNDRTTWAHAATVEAINGVALPMKADWTRPDSEISAFLKQNGRFGIPLTVIYRPKDPNGIILPELLTPEAVKTALNP